MVSERMKVNAYVIVTLALVSAMISPASGALYGDVVEQVGANGKIYWSEGILEAKGVGIPPEKYYGKPQARPLALREAQRAAQGTLMEVIQGARINSTTQAGDVVKGNLEILQQVEGMARSAQMVHRQYLSDGTVEVTLHMPLHGGFTQLFLPPEYRTVTDVKPVKQLSTSPPVPSAGSTSEKGAEPASKESLSGSQVFTGLVVDARGIGAFPAMAPRILDEDGREVFGSAYVSREFAVQQGMCGYAKELNTAKEAPRVASSPLVVKGVKTQGPGHADIIISKADADLIRGASENLSFLKKCRVMIIVD